MDTGKIYRFIAFLKINFSYYFNIKFIKKKIKNLKIKDLSNKNLLSDEVGTESSRISKNKKIRKLVHSFQIELAYNPPKKYDGSCLDGRDITYNIVPDADFKFYITANTKIRALRRFKELKALNKNVTYQEVLKSIKKRDKSDLNRKIAPLKKTKDYYWLIQQTLIKGHVFKIKKIIMKLVINGNIQRSFKSANQEFESY